MITGCPINVRAPEQTSELIHVWGIFIEENVALTIRRTNFWQMLGTSASGGLLQPPSVILPQGMLQASHLLPGDFSLRFITCPPPATQSLRSEWARAAEG